VNGDSLGDRMKNDYENRTRLLLPRRTNTIIRVDGKAFHTFTRGMQRPFCSSFAAAMDETAEIMCRQIQGVRFGFVQSDEISLWLTDYAGPRTSAWFDGNLQKMCSVAASTATAVFNDVTYSINYPFPRGAMFDARVFTIPDIDEVVNYFIWRQQDATRNSISMAAQAQFSHKELMGKSCNQMQEMLFNKGINWNDYPVRFKRGRAIVRETVTEDVMFEDKRTGEKVVAPNVERSSWVGVDPPIFTQDRTFVLGKD